MHRVSAAFLAAAAGLVLTGAGSPSSTIAPHYALTGSIPGPDGLWDYASFDQVRRRLYVSREYGVLAVDVDSGRVTPKFATGQRVHAAFALPEGDKLIATNGDTDTATLLSATSGTVLATLPTGKKPDSAVYDPVTRRVFVMNGKGGDATVIDPTLGKVTGTVPIGGELEFPVADGRGRVYVNVADKAEIAVLDTRAAKVIARYPLAGCEDPSGLAYIATLRVLISVCDNGVAKVLDEGGAELASLTIGKGPDAVIVDQARRLAFVPSGTAGDLSVIAIADRATLRVVERISTAHGAHTGALDPKTGRLYLPTCDYGPELPGGGKRVHLPGTFKVLVVSPMRR